MNIIKASLIVFTLIAATGPAAAQTPDDETPSVTVSGEASVMAAPDMAVLQAGVTSQAKTAREAMAASAKVMNAVMEALKAGGIAEKDIQTTQLRLTPIRDNRPTRDGGTREIIAIEALSMVTVRVHDIEKTADVLDRMVDAGANQATGIDFVVSESSRLLDKARAEAFADARRKAEIYAKAAGVTLGRALSITEGHVARPYMRMAVRDAAAPAPMPIAAGEEKLTVQVSARFELGK
jgi:uncharacterized protein YggE